MAMMVGSEGKVDYLVIRETEQLRVGFKIVESKKFSQGEVNYVGLLLRFRIVAKDEEVLDLQDTVKSEFPKFIIQKVNDERISNTGLIAVKVETDYLKAFLFLKQNIINAMETQEIKYDEKEVDNYINVKLNYLLEDQEAFKSMLDETMEKIKNLPPPEEDSEEDSES